MSDRQDTSLIGDTDDSRRSFMKKGALATGALALGSSAIGTGAAQEETPDDGATGAAGDTVLLLHPDAVENAEFTVASDQLDWSPIGGGQDGATTPGGETPGGETPDVGGETPEVGGETPEVGGETPEVGEETPEDQEVTPDGGAAGAANYETYLIQYEFSASHVAPVFVPDDVDLAQDDQRQFGEIEEVVEQPGGADGATDDDGLTDGAGQAGDPVFVRVSLEDGGVDTGTPGEETPGTPEETPEDGGPGTPGEETPGTPTEEEDDDGGLLG